MNGVEGEGMIITYGADFSLIAAEECHREMHCEEQLMMFTSYNSAVEYIAVGSFSGFSQEFADVRRIADGY